MDARNGSISVVMLPWLAYGHLSPFLEMAKKLSRRNFCIYFCSAPVNLRFIQGKLTDRRRLSFNKTIFQPWAPAAASSLNIPAVLVSIGGAAFLSLILHLDKKPGTPYPFPELFLEDFWWVKITGNALDSANGIKDHGQFVGFLEQSFSIILVKNFREFEAKYIDYLSVLIEKKPVALCPLIGDQTDKDDEGTDIIEWLDKKDKSSAAFVSFGLPMQLDQPVNAKLAELTGVDVEVKRDQNGRLQRKEIAKVIEQVVLRQDGDNQRSKAKEWSEKIRKIGEEEIVEVAKELAKVCGKEKLICAA
ncbi:Beta-D-glucosyl crocetin beta-1,6-glucosyltransferase [Vitis vinifera]|uniref:Beta-D-glucosyl crocetin beta-1,6-glucosyltransferase n=1 Tax=Vitis vinifera TaxID=29760 RepID=A0A438HUB9_VITVI|nr:Beta-D-glucosyl crocetin beta-1,6-glucosyltransferase [Vitis vinifera]